jgi:hypothetical protein
LHHKEPRSANSAPRQRQQPEKEWMSFIAKNNAWAKVTEKFDFPHEDEVPADQLNRVPWKGLIGNKPHPTIRGAKQVVASTRNDD